MTFYVQCSMKTLSILTGMRLFFIPLIMLCNVVSFDHFGHIRASILPLIFSDYQFFVIMFLFGISNGYATTQGNAET